MKTRYCKTDKGFTLYTRCYDHCGSSDIGIDWDHIGYYGTWSELSQAIKRLA